MSATQRNTILSMLEQAGPRGCLTAEFCEAKIERFGARILELRRQLRKEGRDIDSTYVRKGSWRYTLTDSEGLAGRDGPITRGDSTDDEPQRSSLGACQPSRPASLFDLAPVSGTKSAVSGEWL